MTIFIQDNTPTIIQGITGREGYYHTERMLKYGTNIVGGIAPGKGGEWAFGKPVFETVMNAVNATGADTSVIFVPPPNAADAIYEAIDAGIQLIICITEGIPLLDTVRVREYIRLTPSRLIGPSCPGILIPGTTNLGIIPPDISLKGNIGVVSRSGTLMYEVVNLLSDADMGQSAIIGIGGDPVLGTNFVDTLSRFEDDPDTNRVVLIGEIGGTSEIEAADFIRSRMTKPVVAYIAGRHAPLNVKMGHEGAIINVEKSDAKSKIDSLKAAGVRIANRLDEIPNLFLKFNS